MDPQVDWVVLAHHVEVANGLMFVAGGGLHAITPGVSPEGQVPFVALGIGVCVVVPWTHTNRELSLKVSIVNEDGQELFAADGALEAGRAPGMKHGEDTRPMFALNWIGPCPPPGRYRVVAKFASHTKSVPFRVNPGQSMQAA